MSIDYKQAGVDIASGESLVQWLKSTRPEKPPHNERLAQGIGGFAALFRAGFPEMNSPCLVSCTDGVGTKLKWAVEFQRYRSVGQDLVAMCVNDMICCGAQPLFFLDYYACGKLDLKAAKEFLSGVQEACLQSDCALIGGETAEMPGMYREGDFDCAGFSVGVVDEEKALGPHRVKVGDRLIGVSSSGFHSNGYSLLRKLFADDVDQYLEDLMQPTHLYVALAKELFAKTEVHALSHITGGGMDNLPRILPKNTQAVIEAWSWSPLLEEVQKRSELSKLQLMQTFNCGIGLVIVADSNQETAIVEQIGEHGFEAFSLGEVLASEDEEPSWKLS